MNRKMQRLLIAHPAIITPQPNDVILCHSAAINVKTEPPDAVICITLVDGGGNPISGPIQRKATGGRYAGNIDFGDVPSGPAFMRICYAVDGNCANGEEGCCLIPVVVECSPSTEAKMSAKSAAKSGRKSS